MTLEDLLDHPWVGPSFPGRLLGELPKVEKPFGVMDPVESRFHPRIVVETFSTEKRIVLAGAAIGSAVPSQIERELKEGLCVFLPIDMAWLRLRYGFILKRRRTASPAARAFMDIA